MNKYLLIFLLPFVLIGCSNPKKSNELEQIFTNDEIKDLNKIVSFFESQICLKPNSNFKSCFEELLPDLINNGWIPILERLDFEKQKQMYSSIDESTFNEIWQFNESTVIQSKRSFKSIRPKYQGKYQNFLALVAQNNEHIMNYYNVMLEMGNIETTGSFQIIINQFPKSFDLNDINIKLIITIHFLSINDQQKRKEKWID